MIATAPHAIDLGLQVDPLHLTTLRGGVHGRFSGPIRLGAVIGRAREQRDMCAHDHLFFCL
jgi:hypothetical protein